MEPMLNLVLDTTWNWVEVRPCPTCPIDGHFLVRMIYRKFACALGNRLLLLRSLFNPRHFRFEIVCL